MKMALQNVINAKNYKLLDVQRKIKELWVGGDLTDEDKEELLAAAEQNLNPETERPEVMEMLKKLSARIAALEAKHADDNTENDGEGNAQTIPAWKPWDGISSDYVYGAEVTHNGKVWISNFQGQNVWEPGVVGTENVWIEKAE